MKAIGFCLFSVMALIGGLAIPAPQRPPEEPEYCVSVHKDPKMACSCAGQDKEKCTGGNRDTTMCKKYCNLAKCFCCKT